MPHPRRVVARQRRPNGEQGLPQFGVTGWMGLFAPVATPREVIDKLAAASGRALSTPEMKDALVNFTLEPGFAGPDDFDKTYVADVARFRKIVKDANIPLQE